jgi:hypothetical protein
MPVTIAPVAAPLRIAKGIRSASVFRSFRRNHLTVVAIDRPSNTLAEVWFFVVNLHNIFDVPMGGLIARQLVAPLDQMSSDIGHRIIYFCPRLIN